MTSDHPSHAVLEEQVRAVKQQFPELYAHLRRRDAELLQLMRQFPSPADIELSATLNIRARLERMRHIAVRGGIASFDP